MTGPVLRFAPSPTGSLHLGAARTALLNWLQARVAGGRYLLRIEDTDRLRSTPESERAILDGLSWLGIDPDEPPVRQSSRLSRHRRVAEGLLRSGRAYRCSASAETMAELRGLGKRSPWRDKPCVDENAAVRLRADTAGTTAINDLIRGGVEVENRTLDDMVILRSDGTPTYPLAVVVDDHDMGVDLVLRGDDHLTNTFRQIGLYRALGWPVPRFAHIPMILGPDGTKLSKRHGAKDVAEYREIGILPEALFSYLAGLGWGSGDEEIVDPARALEIFDISRVGRSPAKFDADKLAAVNRTAIASLSDDGLRRRIEPFLPESASPSGVSSFMKGVRGLAERGSVLREIVEAGRFYLHPPKRPFDDAEAEKTLARAEPEILKALDAALDGSEIFERPMPALRDISKRRGVPLGDLAKPLRAALTGTMKSPALSEVVQSLGASECRDRFRRNALEAGA